MEIFRHIIFSFLLLALLSSCKKEEPKTYFRTREANEKLILESAIVSVLLKDGRTLDLVGTIHVGSEDYYRHLSSKLKSYDLILYELLGFEKGAKLPPYPWNSRDSLLKKKLGLRYQSSSMDYSSPAFQHADLDKAAFDAFLPQAQAPPKNEALLEIFQRDLSPEERRETLLESIGQYSTLLGGPQSGADLAAARHDVVIKALHSEKAESHKKIAILYGASHLDDLLQKLQPTRVLKVDWLQAW